MRSIRLFGEQVIPALRGLRAVLTTALNIAPQWTQRRFVLPNTLFAIGM